MPKLPFSVKGFFLVRLLFALFLKLSEMFSDALLFGRFLGWLLFLLEFQIVFPYLTLITFHNTLHFTVGCHKCLNIGITVLFQNIGELVQLYGDFILCLLYLLGKCLSLLALEKPCGVFQLLFQLRQYSVLQMHCPALVS